MDSEVDFTSAVWIVWSRPGEKNDALLHVVLVWFIFTHIFVFNKQTKKQIYKLKMSQRAHEETGNRLLA